MKTFFLFISSCLLYNVATAQYSLVSEYEEPNGGRFLDYYLNGDYLYGFNDQTSDFMGVYQVSNGSVINRVGQIDFPDRLFEESNYVVVNNYMYLVNDFLYVIDISNPSNPRLVNTIEEGIDGIRYDPGWIVHSNGKLVITMPFGSFAGEIAMLNLDNPIEPQMMSYWSDGLLGFFGPQSIKLLNPSTAIYWEQSNSGFIITDISGSSLPEPTFSGPNFISLSDKKVYDFEVLNEDMIIGTYGAGFFDDPYAFTFNLSTGELIDETPLPNLSSAYPRIVIDKFNQNMIVPEFDTHIVDYSNPADLIVTETIDAIGRTLYLKDEFFYSQSSGKIEIYSTGASASAQIIADFSSSNSTILEGATIQFSDQSNGNISSWSWTFEGGTPSTSSLQNPTVTYNNVGAFNVSLQVSDGSGLDAETKTDFITVNASTAEALEASFAASATVISAGESIAFSDNSLGNPTAWSWSFAGGSPSSSLSQNQTVTYATPGTYSVSLTIGDGTNIDFIEVPNLITVTGTSNQGLESDSLALIALYNATNGDSWGNNTNWLTGPVETWLGVSVFGGRVDELILENNGLVGPIAPELGYLSNLTLLSLRNNSLTGHIPAEIANLANLESLALHNNELSGIVSESFVNLLNLEILTIQNNPELCEPTSIAYTNWVAGLEEYSNINTCRSIPVFLTFQVQGQAGDAIIDATERNISVTTNCPDQQFIQPSFTLSEDAKAFVNDLEQISGRSLLNLSNPVQYVISVNDEEFIWTVDIIRLGGAQDLELSIDVTNQTGCTESGDGSANVVVNGLGDFFYNFYSINQENTSNSINCSTVEIISNPNPGDYTLDFQDSYNDGWNGAKIIVTIDGMPSEYTIEDGSSGNATVNISENVETLAFAFLGGDWDSEISFQIRAPSGHEMASILPSPQAGPISVYYCSNGSSITELTQGNYLVEVTNKNSGCATYETFEIIGLTPNYVVGASTVAQTNSENPNGSIIVEAIEIGGVIITIPNARFEFEWTSQDGNHELMDLESGQYELTINDLEAGCSITEEYEVLADIEEPTDIITGIEEDLAIKVYPNPARHILHVKDPQNRIARIELVNLTGQLTRTFEANLGHQYDISAMANGIYMMKIELIDAEVFIKKISINR